MSLTCDLLVAESLIAQGGLSEWAYIFITVGVVVSVVVVIAVAKCRAVRKLSSSEVGQSVV